MVLADCLEFKAGTNVAAAESLALLKRARDAAVRARQLGDNSQRLNDLLTRLDTPEPHPRKFSEILEADQAMKDGEQALGTGDYDAALKAYTAALRFDPKLYTAAMYAGEMYFRKKEPAGAADWFTKAVAMNPNNPVVYRHWGDELMLAGRPAEARDKYIEAVITLPVPQSWGALTNWAKRTNHQLSPPRIDRPAVSDQAQAAGSDSMTTSDDGRAAWKSYSAVRAAWRQSIFAEKYPAEKEYRHTLEEEAAALTSVARALDFQKPLHLDPQLATLSELKDGGLVEAWILLTGVVAGIAQDYSAYREKHRLQLRTYIEKYVIRAAGS
jgi:tetratricopeptide (TPR) repeat protein